MTHGDDPEYYGTHDAECWRGGRRHYGCALEEIKRLQSELQLQRELVALHDSQANEAVARRQELEAEIERLQQELAQARAAAAAWKWAAKWWRSWNGWGRWGQRYRHHRELDRAIDAERAQQQEQEQQP